MNCVCGHPEEAHDKHDNRGCFGCPKFARCKKYRPENGMLVQPGHACLPAYAWPPTKANRCPACGWRYPKNEATLVADQAIFMAWVRRTYPEWLNDPEFVRHTQGWEE